MRLIHSDTNRDWIRDVDTWLLLDRVEACIIYLTEARARNEALLLEAKRRAAQCVGR